MLVTRLIDNEYKREFVNKFSNFCSKAPTMISFVLTDRSVVVTHLNSATNYEFFWDFREDLKDFIANIKKVLSNNHYPRLVQVIKIEKPLTPQEQAEIFSKDEVSSEDVPTTKTEIIKKIWRIDKVIINRNTFILLEEDTGDQYLFTMFSYKPCILFLKDYREGVYTVETAADFFFSHSKLVKKLDKTN